MSGNNNNGGPAFPGQHVNYIETLGNVVHDQWSGMTLRDWFAGQAMPMLKNAIYAQGPTRDEAYASVAFESYMIAEAMLAEKKRREAI